MTSSGSAGSGTPPLGIDLNNTDLESGDEERVMCMACRGVYPSRRSLTGHIGRNEKCREIIGRNYLDALAQGVNPPIPGTDAAIKSGAITTGADGMSPVCPFCDRFISHYKGNIRRHINQCRKSAEPMKRHRVEAHEKQSPKKKVKKEQNEMYQHEYNDHDSSSMSGGMMNSPKISPPSSSFYGANSSDLCSPGEYSNSAYEPYPTPMLENTERTSTETAVLQDAYICEDCDFVTVYKGNMKRHLNTCHPQPEFKSLKGNSIEIDPNGYFFQNGIKSWKECELRILESVEIGYRNDWQLIKQTPREEGSHERRRKTTQKRFVFFVSELFKFKILNAKKNFSWIINLS